MKQAIRFALIGCGNIGARHAAHMAAHGRLVAVCDIDRTRAESLGGRYGASVYGSLTDLWRAQTGRVDVAAVCTPNGLHAKHAIDALRAGCHVICEKPMALTVRDCRAMIREARRARRRLFVVKQNRYNPPVVAVKRLLERGRLGRISSVQLNCFWNRNREYYRQSPWRGTRNLDGGVLFTQFSHFIDLMHWLVGDAAVRSAYASNSDHPYTQIDDHGTAVFQFRNGAVGTLAYSINAYQANMEGSLMLIGSRGTAKIGGQYLNTLEYLRCKGAKPGRLAAGGGANDYGTYQGSMSNHDKVYRNVVEVLKGRAAITASGKDGLRTVRTIADIYAKARAPRT